MHPMTEHDLNRILERHMATLNEKLDALTTAVTNLTAAFAGIAKPEDLTPVENALADLKNTVTDIRDDTKPPDMPPPNPPVSEKLPPK